MFNLNPGVHFNEIELSVFIEEFEGTSTAVADLAAGIGAARADLVDETSGDPRGGRFLDDFLVPTLHGAVALAQMDRVAVFVGENLNLDMARILKKFFQVDRRVPKCGTRFLAGRIDGIHECSFGVDDPHAASAPSARGFDDHRVSDRARDLDDFPGVFGQGAFTACHDRHPSSLHGIFGTDLVTHQSDRVRSRTDEDKAAFFNPLGEVGIFGKKSVPGMDGFGVGYLGR